MNYINEFENYAASCGLRFDGEIHCDGQLHRIQVDGDKRGKKNGWYIFHNEVIPVCIFGTWKGEQKFVWSAKHESKLNRLERERLKKMLADASRSARRQKKSEQMMVAAECIEIYKNAQSVTNHGYLDKKLIKTNDILRLGERGELIIPVISTNGVINSLQYVHKTGGKMFHPGGATKDCFCYLKGYEDVIFVCEGYATGATINEATGRSVYVAFNCGNLISIVKHAQNKSQKSIIVIAADDDFMTKEPIDNPGKHHAELTAKATGCSIIYPKFDAYHRKADQTDFNDMHYEGVTNSIDNYVRNYIFEQMEAIECMN